jgi:hypothetical protein
MVFPVVGQALIERAVLLGCDVHLDYKSRWASPWLSSLLEVSTENFEAFLLEDLEE